MRAAVEVRNASRSGLFQELPSIDVAIEQLGLGRRAAVHRHVGVGSSVPGDVGELDTVSTELRGAAGSGRGGDLGERKRRRGRNQLDRHQAVGQPGLRGGHRVDVGAVGQPGWIDGERQRFRRRAA